MIHLLLFDIRRVGLEHKSLALSKSIGYWYFKSIPKTIAGIILCASFFLN